MKSEVHVMKSLVEYQEGTIVSKTIISNGSGTVTIFAFDKDQALSEHTAPFDALVYVIDGEVEITIAEDLYTLKKGETIIMPADIPHALKATKQFKMMLVMIKE